MEQNRESRNGPKYTQLIFNIDVKAIQWRKVVIFISVNRTRKKATECENTYTNHVSAKKYFSLQYKNSENSD